MAVMMDQMPIGEVILKDINAEAKQCTLSITCRMIPSKSTFWKRLDFRKPAAMIDSCILDATKKPGTDVTGQIVLFDHSKPCFIDIIAQSHPERNKIFILLRSPDSEEIPDVFIWRPPLFSARPLASPAAERLRSSRNKILVLCRWAAAHSHMNNRFLSNGGILLSFFDFFEKKSLFPCPRTFSFPQSFSDSTFRFICKFLLYFCNQLH